MLLAIFKVLEKSFAMLISCTAKIQELLPTSTPNCICTAVLKSPITTKPPPYLGNPALRNKITEHKWVNKIMLTLFPSFNLRCGCVQWLFHEFVSRWRIKREGLDYGWISTPMLRSPKLFRQRWMGVVYLWELFTYRDWLLVASIYLCYGILL